MGQMISYIASNIYWISCKKNGDTRVSTFVIRQVLNKFLTLGQGQYEYA